jgi:hypothetical protein
VIHIDFLMRHQPIVKRSDTWQKSA